ncbi:MAG TPA: VanZ family protein [Patescibacteria group bacterium]|nr:VanZ family protein [Patescibacteria group bacterium]
MLFRWLSVILWAAFIFYLSSIPDLRSALPDFWDLVLRKFAHAGEYAVLAILLVRAIGIARNSPSTKLKSWRSFGAIDGSVTTVLAVVALYALSDEIHQSFVPGRVASLFDMGVDVIGGSIGLLAYFRWTQMSNQK